MDTKEEAGKKAAFTMRHCMPRNCGRRQKETEGKKKPHLDKPQGLDQQDSVRVGDADVSMIRYGQALRELREG